MLPLLVDVDGSNLIWPMYWIHNRLGKWAWGQFPPELSLPDFRKMMRELGIDWVS